MRFLLTVVACCMLSCSDPYEHIPTHGPSPEKSILTAQPIDPTLRASIEEANHLRDFLTLKDVVQFPDTDQYQPGSITAAFMIDDHWFFFDRFTQQVLKADKKGHILQAIGSLGEGPGEYEQVSTIVPVWEDHIGVVNQGIIDIFNKDGKFEKEILVRSGREAFHIRNHLIWQDPDQLMIADFPTHAKRAPLYVALQYDGENFSKQFFFGERLRDQQPYNAFTPWAVQIFNKVEDTIWTSNPYRSQFEIYGLNGALAKTLPIRHPQVLKESDFAKVDSEKDMAQLFTQNYRGFKVIQVGSIVLAFYAGPDSVLCDVYDTAGELIKGGLSTYRAFLNPIYAQHDTLYFVVEYPNKMETWTRYLQAHELAFLQQKGINTITPSSGASFLVSMEIPK